MSRTVLLDNLSRNSCIHNQRAETHTLKKNKIKTKPDVFNGILRSQKRRRLCLTVKTFQTEYTFYLHSNFNCVLLLLGNLTAREGAVRISGETHGIGKRARATGERIGIHVRSVKQGKGFRLLFTCIISYGKVFFRMCKIILKSKETLVQFLSALCNATLPSRERNLLPKRRIA